MCSYGRGRVFGHIPYILPEFRVYQPVTVRVTSIEAECYVISATEFEKRILCFNKVLDYFKSAAHGALYANSVIKLGVYSHFSKFHNTNSDRLEDEM